MRICEKPGFQRSIAGGLRAFSVDAEEGQAAQRRRCLSSSRAATLESYCRDWRTRLCCFIPGNTGRRREVPAVRRNTGSAGREGDYLVRGRRGITTPALALRGGTGGSTALIRYPDAG